MSAADVLLSRLERVKRTGPGRWIASSPTREDRSPSLAIRELEDGSLLVHDFGGDDIASVMAAVGLDVADLYPRQPRRHSQPIALPFRASDVLAMVAFEAAVAVVVCSDVLNKKVVSDGDLQRLVLAAGRLADAVEVCGAHR